MNGRGRTCWGSHGALKSSIYRFEWAHTYVFSSVERIRERNGRPRPNFVILYHELGSMPDERDTIPAEALKEVAYLSRSANRVEILQTLTRESHTRRDLTELTGASRTTLDRIVNELEDRGWARRTDDGDYTATPAGDHLMAQLLPFVESVVRFERQSTPAETASEASSLQVQRPMDSD